MIKNSMTYIIIFLLSVFVSSCSQIALKKSANKQYDNSIKEIMNPTVLGAYSCFLISSLLTVWAYRGVALSWGAVLETTSYIYIMVLSNLFLKEKITKRKVVGNFCIIVGICVYALLG